MGGCLWLRPCSTQLSWPMGLAALPVGWSLWGCREGWLGEDEAGAHERAADPSVLPQPTPPPPAVPPTKQQYLCQPLLDAVLANIRSPVFNHSLYRTFVPAMAAIHGPPIQCVPWGLAGGRAGPQPGQGVSMAASSRAPVVSTRKRKFEEDERQSIPNVLQGEVARLDPKFLVNLDPSHCSNNGTVHLICKLGECWGGAGGTACSPQPSPPGTWNLPAVVLGPHAWGCTCLGAGPEPALSHPPPRPAPGTEAPPSHPAAALCA